MISPISFHSFIDELLKIAGASNEGFEALMQGMKSHVAKTVAGGAPASAANPFKRIAATAVRKPPPLPGMAKAITA